MSACHSQSDRGLGALLTPPTSPSPPHREPRGPLPAPAAAPQQQAGCSHSAVMPSFSDSTLLNTTKNEIVISQVDVSPNSLFLSEIPQFLQPPSSLHQAFRLSTGPSDSSSETPFIFFLPLLNVIFLVLLFILPFRCFASSSLFVLRFSRAKTLLKFHLLSGKPQTRSMLRK